MKIRQFFSVFLMGLFFLTKISFALPFSVTPLFTPTTVVQGQQTLAYYKVTNTTTKAAPGSFVKFLPVNVKQGINTFNKNLCSATFNLAPQNQVGDSCILKLVIAGPVNPNDTNPEHQIFVCREKGKTCAGTTSPLNVSSISLVSIQVEPNPATIPKGTTQRFFATGNFSDGSSRQIGLVTWSSGDDTTATINDVGLATGVASGAVTITATSGLIHGSASLTVDNATLSSIAVTPDNGVIHAGTTLPYTAEGTYSDQTTQTLTQEVTWISSNTAIADINGGIATGVSAGTAHISAKLGAITSPTVPLKVEAPALISITVTPTNPTIGVGTMLQFIATGNFSAPPLNQDITSSVTWSSTDHSVATINSFFGAGIATGLEFGGTTIQATLGGLSGSTNLNVAAVVPIPVYAGTENGKVCVSTNNGLSWDNCNLSPINSPVNALVTDIEGNVFWGLQNGQACVKLSNGVFCGNVNDGTHPVSALAIGGSNIYAATDVNVCVSDDDGLTWANCNPPDVSNVVVALATDSSHVYAGTTGNNVCISPDGGLIWGSCNTPDGNLPTALATDTGYVYAGTDGGTVCVSTDDGQSWITPCATISGPVTSLAVDSEGLVYAGTSNGFVCVSYDHGSQWPNCVPVNTNILSLATGLGFIFAGTQSGNACVSTNEGTTWPSLNCKMPTGTTSPVNALAVALL